MLGEKINGDFYMRVLVLGGSTASVQAGHQVTLCTPYYALGEDAAGSWAVHSQAGWEAYRQRLGCAMTFGDRETGRTQNYSQWRMCDSAHAGYQRLDQGTLNDPGKDSLSKEIQRCLHDPLAYDLVNMLTPREDRRLCGRVCVTLEDVMRGNAFADTLCHTFSTYDPHGRSFHPSGRLGLLPAQDATRYAPVPLRALLPRGIDNMLVCGKALSMDQDALNYARMAPDVMCVGYLAGRVAGMCVKQQCAAQARALFEHLLQRQEADYASRADADVYARMRCAASLESLLDVYLERLEALAVNQSGYGYLVDEAIRCMEERLHKNSLSLQEVSDYVSVFFIQSPRFRVFDQRRLGLDSVFILSNHGKNVKSSIVNLCISIRILTKKAAE